MYIKKYTYNLEMHIQNLKSYKINNNKYTVIRMGEEIKLKIAHCLAIIFRYGY